MSRIRVYCAVSLDGSIAGPDDDLSWLGQPDPEEVGDPGTVGFPAFMEQTGAMLMGRRTFDTVMGFASRPHARLATRTSISMVGTSSRRRSTPAASMS